MKKEKFPPISVIIPVYNEEKRLGGCLKSIVDQNYPREKIEILVVDDNSTDKTPAVAMKFGAKILHNGSRNIERGKSIGLKNASHEFIFLLDADNRLPHPNWLANLIRAMEDHPEAVGAEAIWFHYDPGHTLADRYCELFGINDPMAYYLQRRDRLMATEERWQLPGKIVKETDKYYLVQFSRENLLTVGSQGFLTRKSLLLKTSWQPYLFHMDSNMDLISQGFNRYLMMKDSIIHLHCQTTGQFIGKLKRNFTLFLKQENIRRYTWRTKPVRLFLVTLSMLTFIRPTFDSLKGFAKKPDLAWFLNPIYSFCIPAIYLYYTFKGFEFRKILRGQ